MKNTSRLIAIGLAAILGLSAGGAPASAAERRVPEVLEWNQVFIETLIATNAVNAASPRLGAIVHTAIFDANNGIERRYTPIFVRERAPRGASRRAAVVAAAYTALVGLFPSHRDVLDMRYADSLAVLGEGRSVELGLQWGTSVAEAVLAWRAADGFAASYPPFTGGTEVGQWRPTPPNFTAMSVQGLAFATPFVLDSNTQFRPAPARTLDSARYALDFEAVKALGRKTGSTRTDDQTALAPFWEGSASVHWNQAANQIARARCLSASASTRLLAVLNVAMADTMFTTWSAKRFYGGTPGVATWRPVTAIPLADIDENPATGAEPGWEPLMNTPSHPEYPAGHPSLNGAGASVLLLHFRDAQTFTLTTPGQPNRTYSSISLARADGNNARVWGGMHYPSTVKVSDTLGKTIAHYVNGHFMQPRHRRH
jgi:membrane-associated phospholipid phosphatase